MAKEKPSDRLRRNGPFRDPYPRILVVCEGEVTEKEYLNYLRHSERIPLNIVIETGGTPKTLVEKAVRLKNEEAYESVWCVFDIDEHPKIPEARNQAQANNIQLAISNPCFDLWLLLHFQDQRAHIHRHKVQSACRKYMKGYDKSPPCHQLMPLLKEADQRAREIHKRQTAQNTLGANPSTTAFELVAQIRAYGRRS